MQMKRENFNLWEERKKWKIELPDTKNNKPNNPRSETKKRSSEEVVIDLLSATQDSTSNNQQKLNQPPESPAKYNRHSIEETIIPDL